MQTYLTLSTPSHPGGVEAVDMLKVPEVYRSEEDVVAVMEA